MFSLLVALTMYLTMAPAVPQVTLQDFRAKPSARSLPIAAGRKVETGPIMKDKKRLGVATSARAVEVVDWKSGKPLFEKNADEALPIASITKLMTALVALSGQPDWHKVIEISGSDDRPGGIAYVAPGERVTVEQLFHLSLIASANNATIALARSTGMTESEFVAEMNAMAKAIGMRNASFADPTGLDPANAASARDVALLIKTALLRTEIREAVAQDSYRSATKAGREFAVRNTDELLSSFLNRPPYAFFGGKTGYLEEAGYCLGAAAQNSDGNRVIAVVLGTSSKEQRFREVKALLHWAFDVYEWPSVK